MWNVLVHDTSKETSVSLYLWCAGYYIDSRLWENSFYYFSSFCFCFSISSSTSWSINRWEGKKKRNSRVNLIDIWLSLVRQSGQTSSEVIHKNPLFKFSFSVKVLVVMSSRYGRELLVYFFSIPPFGLLRLFFRVSVWWVLVFEPWYGPQLIWWPVANV